MEVNISEIEMYAAIQDVRYGDELSVNYGNFKCTTRIKLTISICCDFSSVSWYFLYLVIIVEIINGIKFLRSILLKNN